MLIQSLESPTMNYLKPLFTFILAVNMAAAQIPDPIVSDDASGATIYRYDLGDVNVHGFVNTPAGAGNGTYVIEGATSLVLIDSHFSAESAAAFRAYADSLNKTIDRIYVTHDHPDHIGGLKTAFADIPSFATAGTIAAAAESGISIGNVATLDSLVIDDIQFEFDLFVDGEAEEALVIKLPELGVMAAGDILYNDYHMVMNRQVGNWPGQIDQLAAMDQYQLLLPGHGEPTGPEIYAEAKAYLSTAIELYNSIDDPQQFQNQMVTAYPDVRSPFFLDLAIERMYPKAVPEPSSYFLLLPFLGWGLSLRRTRPS